VRMTIGNRPVGDGFPLFVVAEIGLNHSGSVEEALALVDAAAAAGADAVKLQSLRGETLVAPSCPPPAHVACESLQAFFRQFELDAEAHAAVAQRARERGVAFMSTPFDLEAVDMLERLDCAAFKIASGDLTHHALIARVAATRKPVILSTGMSELDEVAAAVGCARAAGARELALLHCVSAYPVPHGSENLRAIATLANEFGVVVGLSDHGTDHDDVILAVALGASIYERHFVAGADSTAIDAAVSSTPEQLAAAITAAARAQSALGDGRRTCAGAELPNRLPSRRGLYARRALRKGDIVAAGDVIALRPATGLSAHRLGALVGTRLVRAVAAGEPFVENDVTAQQPAGRGGRDAA
jgi:sialic acid synthase SpsE